MSEQQQAPVAAEAVNGPARAPEETSLEDFVIAACGLTSAISDWVVFSENGVGPAEWVILKVVKARPLTMTELVRQTSLSRQRVGLLVKELVSKRFISVSARTDGDRRMRIVEVLPPGTETLENISRRLEELSVPKSPKRFAAAVKQTEVLLRLLRRQRQVRAQTQG